MPNVIEFLVPNPAKLPLDFTLTPAPFRAQFVSVPALTKSLPDPSIPNEYIQLLADALDSGYGANAAPMPSLPPTDRIALYRHLAQQLELALTLMKRLPSGEWVLQPFASEIEKTAKTTHSYLLGMLYASVATRLWGQANGWGDICQFWHYGVLASSAANFMSGVAYVEENPDYLVEFDGGTWACVEAKGSLSDQNNADLKKGLSQACKLTQVKWQKASVPTPTVVSPTQQACAMTYFSAPDNTLEVLLMDPPADAVDALSPNPKAPLLFKEGGDFLRWAQALEQFEGMASMSERHDSRLQLERFDWARSSSQHDVWVGVPKIMRRHAETINSALSLLEWLVPILSGWRKKPSVIARAVNRRLSNMARYASRRANSVGPGRAGNRPLMWGRVASFFNERRRGNKEMISWVEVLRDIWFLEIFSISDSPLDLGYDAVETLEDLWILFSRVVVIERNQWELSDAADGGDTTNVSFAKTTHGLIVVALDTSPEKMVRPRRPRIRL